MESKELKKHLQNINANLLNYNLLKLKGKIMTTEQYEKEIENTMKDMATMGFKKLSLSPADVSQILDVNISTLYNWRRDKIGPQYIQNNSGKRNKVIYTPRSIAAYLLDQQLTA